MESANQRMQRKDVRKHGGGKGTASVIMDRMGRSTQLPPSWMPGGPTILGNAASTYNTGYTEI